MTRAAIDLAVATLPVGLRDALARCGYASKRITVEARDESSISTGWSRSKISFACSIDDVRTIGAVRVERGAFGGANGYNRTRGSWDPDHDSMRYPVPRDGALVYGYSDSAWVIVRAATLADIVQPGSGEPIRDARLEQRSDATEIADRIVANAIASAVPEVTDDERAVPRYEVLTEWRRSDGTTYTERTGATENADSPEQACEHAQRRGIGWGLGFRSDYIGLVAVEVRS